MLWCRVRCSRPLWVGLAACLALQADSAYQPMRQCIPSFSLCWGEHWAMRLASCSPLVQGLFFGIRPNLKRC